MEITVCGKDITIQQRGKGRIVKQWGALRYKHNLFIKIGAKTASFPFYGSEEDRENRVNVLPDDDLKHALSCFFDDAISGEPVSYTHLTLPTICSV